GVPAEDVVALRADDILCLKAQQFLSGCVPGDDALVAIDDVGAVGGAVEQFAQEFLVGHAVCSYVLCPGGRRYVTCLYGFTPRATSSIRVWPETCIKVSR